MLYDKYSTGGAFDVPMQNTIKWSTWCSKICIRLRMTRVEGGGGGGGGGLFQPRPQPTISISLVSSIFDC